MNINTIERSVIIKPKPLNDKFRIIKIGENQWKLIIKIKGVYNKDEILEFNTNYIVENIDRINERYNIKLEKNYFYESK